MSDDDEPEPIALPRTVTVSDPIPTFLESSSMTTGRHERGPNTDEQVAYLVVHVDRLKQTNKLLKWAAATAITFALGSAFAVARLLYGMGSDDATVKAAIERAQRQADENKADVRELQKFMYRRFGVDATRPTPPITKDDQP